MRNMFANRVLWPVVVLGSTAALLNGGLHETGPLPEGSGKTSPIAVPASGDVPDSASAIDSSPKPHASSPSPAHELGVAVEPDRDSGKGRYWNPYATPANGQGFGTVVDKALRSMKPQEAMEAAEALDRCRTAAARTASMREGVHDPAFRERQSRMVQLTQLAENYERACQSLDAGRYAEWGRLMQIAVDGRAFGAAVLAFDVRHSIGLDEHQARQQVFDAAQRGDGEAIWKLGEFGHWFGLSANETRMYQIAAEFWTEQAGPEHRWMKLRKSWPVRGYEATPEAEEAARHGAIQFMKAIAPDRKN